MTLKILGLYIDVLFNRSHILQYVKYTESINTAKGIANLHVNMFFKQKQQQQKSEHKSPCQSWESNTRPLAPQSGALPLDHRVSRVYGSMIY